jgi:hypothetical protein
MELEALQEQFFLLKEGRIRFLGEQLLRLRGELAGRDLADVPTDRLFELLLKHHAALREEFVEVRPLSDREAARLKSLTARDAAWPGTGQNWTKNEQREDRPGARAAAPA